MDNGPVEEGTFEQPVDSLLFGRSTLSQGGRKRGGVKRTKGKKEKKPPVGRTTMEGCFEDIGLGDESAREEPAAERPPFKKRKTGAEVRSVYRYPCARAL